MKAAAINVVGALVIALVLAGLGLQLDGPDDVQAERDQARALELAQQLDAIDRRADQVAAGMCRALEGPNAGHRWTPAGEVVCVTRRTEYVLTTAVRP